MILAAVVSIFILALIAPGVQRLLPNRAGWVLSTLPLALTVFFATKIAQINGGQIIIGSHAWVPGLGVSLSFYLDGLSLVFSLLICGVGTLIVIYSGGYLSGHVNLGRFYTFSHDVETDCFRELHERADNLAVGFVGGADIDQL